MAPTTMDTWRDELSAVDFGSSAPDKSAPGDLPEPDYEQRLTVEKQQTADDDPSLGEREVKFIASTAAEDRDGDVIDQGGLKLGDFNRSGVFLWSHRQDLPPLGEVRAAGVEQGRMTTVVRFPTPEEFGEAADHPWVQKIELVYQLYKNNLLHAVSIGFLADPDDVEEREGGGFRFEQVEVIELSAVSVPSNRGAVAVQRAMGSESPQGFRNALQSIADKCKVDLTTKTADKAPDDFPAPPETVRQACDTGLEWHEEGYSGDGMQASTVRWAGKMADGEAPTQDKALKMGSWFSRHLAQDGPLRDEDGNPTPRAVAIKLWGGADAGPSYTRRLYRVMERDIPDGLAQLDAPSGQTKGVTESHQKESRTLSKANERRALTAMAEIHEMMVEHDEERAMQALEGLRQGNSLMSDEDNMDDEDKDIGDLTATIKADASEAKAELREVQKLLENIKSLEDETGVSADEVAERVHLVFMPGASKNTVESMQPRFDGIAPKGHQFVLMTCPKDTSPEVKTIGAESGTEMGDSPEVADMAQDLVGAEASLKGDSDLPVKSYETKEVTDYRDLGLAPRDREWDSAAAVGRWRQFADATEEPTEQYKGNFVWYDADEPGQFQSYKLPYGDVVDDNQIAVPRGIFAAAAALEGARGGVDIPESEVDDAKAHIQQYYEKMREKFGDDDMMAPWQTENSFNVWMARQANLLDIDRAPTLWLQEKMVDGRFKCPDTAQPDDKAPAPDSSDVDKTDDSDTEARPPDEASEADVIRLNL